MEIKINNFAYMCVCVCSKNDERYMIPTTLVALARGPVDSTYTWISHTHAHTYVHVSSIHFLHVFVSM